MMPKAKIPKKVDSATTQHHSFSLRSLPAALAIPTEPNHELMAMLRWRWREHNKLTLFLIPWAVFQTHIPTASSSWGFTPHRFASWKHF